MTRQTGNFDDFGMATVTLAGPLEVRLAAIRDAGFTQVMLDAGDIAQHPGGLEAAARAVKGSGLRVTRLPVVARLRGAVGPAARLQSSESPRPCCRWRRRSARRCWMVSSFDPPASAKDQAAIARRLAQARDAGDPAGPESGLRRRWRRQGVRDCFEAWDAVDRADVPNLGVAIDTRPHLAGRDPAG